MVFNSIIKGDIKSLIMKNKKENKHINEEIVSKEMIKLALELVFPDRKCIEVSRLKKYHSQRYQA